MTLKKIVCLFVVFFILTMSCTPLVFAMMPGLQDLPNISVPYQQPSAPYVMCIWQNKNNGTFLCRMWTFDFLIVDDANSIPPESVRIWCELNANTYQLDVYCAALDDIVNFADVCCYRQFYTWSSGNDYYRIYDAKSYSTNVEGTWVLNPLSYTTITPDTHQLLGIFVGNGLTYSVTYPSNDDINYAENLVSFTFNGQLDQNLFELGLDELMQISWDTADISTYTASIFGVVTLTDNKMRIVNEQLGDIIDILLEMNDIVTTESTTNGAVSDFVAAEDEVLGNSFGNLQSFEPEPFDLIEGSNSYNALLFIGDLLDFFTSKGKFRSAILVVFSLAIAGILINLYPLNKGD